VPEGSDKTAVALEMFVFSRTINHRDSAIEYQKVSRLFSQYIFNTLKSNHIPLHTAINKFGFTLEEKYQLDGVLKDSISPDENARISYARVVCLQLLYVILFFIFNLGLFINFIFTLSLYIYI
jgi:hypothetical protein